MLEELKKEIAEARRLVGTGRGIPAVMIFLAEHGEKLIAAAELAENEAAMKALGERVRALEPEPSVGAELTPDEWCEIDNQQELILRERGGLAQKSKSLVAAYRKAVLEEPGNES